MTNFKIIKIKAIEKDMTYNDIAKKIGTSEQTISNWSNERNISTIKSFIKLCKLLDIEIKDFKI